MDCPDTRFSSLNMEKKDGAKVNIHIKIYLLTYCTKVMQLGKIFSLTTELPQVA